MADTNLSKANKPSFGTRVKRFFKDTKAELKRSHGLTRNSLFITQA